MIDIKDISGKVRFSTPINEGSKRKFTLQKEDYITLKFSLDTPIYFKLGDYVEDSRFGRFELVDLQKPTFNNSTGGYDYELRLDAYYWKWKNKIFKLTPEVGGQEASWNLTASLDVQMGVFLRNLKALGYKYGERNFEFDIDSTVENSAKLMTYDSVNMLDALTNLAQAWECEWWVTDHTIHFGRCEFGAAVDFKLGDNVETMDRSDSQTAYATRVYAFGSTRNIPTNYRPVDESVVVNGVVQRRLMLPVGTPYIDAYPDMSTEEAIEDIVVFEDVYPKRIGTVSDITTHEYTDKIEEEGKPDVIKKWNAYRFKDSGITFSEDYVLPGQELKIVFQSGSLNGMEFAVTFNPCDKEGGEKAQPEKNEDGSWNPLAQVWEIVRNEDYGRPLPDEVLRPQGEHMEGNVLVPADTYILSGFDTKFVSDAMIPAAEQELKEKAQKYVEKSKIDPSTYSCKMMSDRMINEDGTPKLFEAGDKVNLINEAFFETGSRQSRIIGFEYNLDYPWDSPVYTIGETASYSRIGDIEDKLESLTYKGQTYVGSGGGGVYLITSNDSTPATDRNAYSAKRALRQFLNKTADDRTDHSLEIGGELTVEGLIKTLSGILLGKNGRGITVNDVGIVTAIFDELKNVSSITSPDFSSGPFGSGYLLKVNPKTGKSYFEVDEAYFRLKAVFEMLEIKHLSHVGGRVVLSPAGMECIKVEEVAANNEPLYDSTGDQLLDSNNEELLAPVFDGSTAYRCYFKQTDGEKEIVNEFAVGDLAQCREFNVKSGVSTGVSNQYYWRRVTGTGSDYIDLSKTVCDTGSMIPLAGDTIVTVGNDTDKDRQHVVFLSSYDEDAPSIKLYSGINNFSMKGREVTVISPNADKNLFTGQMVIKPGSTGFENLTDAPDIGAIQEDIKDAQSAASDAKISADKVQGSVTDLNKYVDGAFADGIISESEAKAIEKYINIVNSEKSTADSSYLQLYSNPYLEGFAKVSLMNAKSSLSDATTTLINSINTAIADGKTTIAEKNDVDSKYGLFNQAYGIFYEAVESANKSIQNKLKSYADNAQKAADEANNNASTAMESANNASAAVSDLNEYVDGAFADGIISEAEAKSIEKYINAVNATKNEVEATYDVLYSNLFLEGTAKTGLSTAKTDFTTSVSNLIAAIQAAIADGKTTNAEKDNVDSKYTLFSNAYAAMKTAIENANKSIQEKIRALAASDAVKEAVSQIEKVTVAAKNDVAKQMGYADYAAMQSAAVKGNTLITGGKINTSLIEADLIVTTALIASAIKASSLNINDKFIVYKDGSVDLQGILHSIGPNTEVIISDGYLRILYNGADVMRLAVNQTTGMPELNMRSGNKTLFASPDQLVFGFGSGNSFLSLRPEDIGAGSIRKNSDGTLVVTNSVVTVITVSISCSPQEGGTTSPSPSPLLMRNQGETEYVEAFPNAGYQFDRWSDGGAQRHLVTWDKSGKSVTAYFTKLQVQRYTVTLKASPVGGGSVSGGGIADAGTVRAVSAIPGSGYRFVEWSDKGSASHNVTWDGDKTLTAYFEAYAVTGDEIFLGTNLQDNTYITKYKQGTSGLFYVAVSNGKMQMSYMGTNIDWINNTGWVLFNKGNLGSKLLKGHKYRLRFTAITPSYTATAIAGIGTFNTSTGELESDITLQNEIIYGDEVTTVAKEFILDLTPRRDSTVNDSLYVCFIPPGTGCVVNVKDISLKEI
ncbi:hypothetical protein [Bacteroides sp.]|uniref:InlB B-repeat-containing protein n=1 Tax=Bacteroides sp. TaxID=29523 RepID=UPI00262E0C69|nr:hypothetical protein [Bacteroides sp.]